MEGKHMLGPEHFKAQLTAFCSYLQQLESSTHCRCLIRRMCGSGRGCEVTRRLADAVCLFKVEFDVYSRVVMENPL